MIPYLGISAIRPAPVVLGDPLGRLWYRTCRIALIPDHRISLPNDYADALRMSKRLWDGMGATLHIMTRVATIPSSSSSVCPSVNRVVLASSSLLLPLVLAELLLLLRLLFWELLDFLQTFCKILASGILQTDLRQISTYSTFLHFFWGVL